MSWFYEIRDRESAKNGRIRARRYLGNWNVSVANCGQTSPYLNHMWKDAFLKLSSYLGSQRIKSVLMLGLGAGGEIAKIHREYPGSRLTVIEYDEEMITLAKELKLYHPAPFPRVICEDAARAVPKLSETFDLIIVDLFKGSAPSPLSEDPIFLDTLHAKLSKNGFMLVNVYKGKEIFVHIAKKFLTLKEWKFNTLSHVGLFTKNAVPEAIADGYLPVQEWPDFNHVPAMSDLHGSYLGEGKKSGLYWRLGPFSFEKYFGDSEPVIAPLPKDKVRPVRVIMWQRHRGADTPEKWASFGRQLAHKIGFLRLGPDYAKEWSETAKRYLKKWQKEFLNVIYIVEEVSYDEFAETYLQSTIPTFLRGPTLWGIRMRMKNPNTALTFTIARRIHDGRIVAGMACMQSSRLSASYYMAGFITKEVRNNDPVMTGLFDHWFQWCMARGVHFADFGGFWWKGGDNSWKGLSRFKGKFNPLYFFYPATLYKFMFGGGAPTQKS